MTEEKTYIMTEEDKKFMELEKKVLPELGSQENILYDELVRRSLEINKISMEELEHRFDELTAFGFNVRKVPKYSCLLPYHIMFSDWTPENYRKDRIAMLAKYGKDEHFIIEFGLCSQEFNTNSDRSFERFLHLVDTFERGKKKVEAALEKTRKEQEEIEREIEKVKQELAANLEIRSNLLRRIVEKPEIKGSRQRSKDTTKRMKKHLFLSRSRRVAGFLVGHRIANRIWLSMIMKDEVFREVFAEKPFGRRSGGGQIRD